ncbi:MAG: hypothetical protein E7644_03630 [Ruminococcaceae bacterium]|nr:hypothetical protein [Oscillospiraceae bacterium]
MSSNRFGIRVFAEFVWLDNLGIGNKTLYKRELSLRKIYWILCDKQIITYSAPFFNISVKKFKTTVRHNASFFDRYVSLSRGRVSHKPISTVTLDDLCRFLDCRVEDILVYIEDEK